MGVADKPTRCPSFEVPGRKTEPCGKVPQKGSAYCPKHALYATEMRGEMERRMEKARRGKDAKAAKREALKDSPLAGFNPEFGKKDQTYAQ